MDCNSELRIPKGLDFYLMVKVTDNRGDTSSAVDLSAVENLDVCLLQQNALMRKRTMLYNIMESNTSVIMMKVTDLATGDYGVQISYTVNGQKFCGRELDVFGIVWRNKDSNFVKTEMECESCGAINLTTKVYVSGDAPVPTSGNIYYGVTDNLPYNVGDVSSLTEMSIKALGKTGVSYTEGQSVVILIPSTSSLKGYQDNGFGEKVAFNEYEQTVQVGCNGQEVTIGKDKYKVYGQLFLNSGTCYIYIA